MLKSNVRRAGTLWGCPGLPILLFLLTLATTGKAVAETPKLPIPVSDRLPQIIGGAPSAPENYPWMAALLDTEFLNDSDPFLAQYCGATVISGRWALTTAHCLFEGARQKSDDWIMPRLDDRPSIPKNPQSVH